MACPPFTINISSGLIPAASKLGIITGMVCGANFLQVLMQKQIEPPGSAM
jgi:hypothetical protein